MWGLPRRSPSRPLWAALADAVPRVDLYRDNRRIEIHQSQMWYITGDGPDLQKAARGWEAKLADALGRGYDDLRVAASAPQLKDKEWAEFFEDEK